MAFIVSPDSSPGIQRLLRLPGAGHLRGALPGSEDVLSDGPVASSGLQTGGTVLLRTQARVRRGHGAAATHNTAASHPSAHRHHDC